MLNNRQNNQFFKKCGMVIEVDLHYNGYMVRGKQLKTGNRESNTYNITFELRRKDISKWDVLDEKVFHLESDNINLDTAKFIQDKFAEGYFKRFIDSYEYELACTDKGIEVIENEQLTQSH